MKCARLEKLLPMYLENELSPKEMRLVEKHLAQCSSCADILASLTKINSILASLPELEVSPSLQARLYAIPYQKKAPAKKFSALFDWLLRPSLQPILAAASIFLFIISFFLFHPDGRFLSRTLNEQVHVGLSRVERFVAKAEGLPGYLPVVRESIQKSLKNISSSRPQASEKI